MFLFFLSFTPISPIPHSRFFPRLTEIYFLLVVPPGLSLRARQRRDARQRCDHEQRHRRHRRHRHDEHRHQQHRRRHHTATATASATAASNATAAAAAASLAANADSMRHETACRAAALMATSPTQEHIYIYIYHLKKRKTFLFTHSSHKIVHHACLTPQSVSYLSHENRVFIHFKQECLTPHFVPICHTRNAVLIMSTIDSNHLVFPVVSRKTVVFKIMIMTVSHLIIFPSGTHCPSPLSPPPPEGTPTRGCFCVRSGPDPPAHARGRLASLSG